MTALPTETPTEVNALESESDLKPIEVGENHGSLHLDLPEKEQDLEAAALGDTNHSASQPAKGVDSDWNALAENPQNWSMTKRIMHIVPIGLFAFAVTCGSSLITPAAFEIAAHFNVSRTAAILSLTLYVLGLALGPVIGAPISETYGRSVVYKLSGPVYILFILGGALSPTFGGLLACRLLAGMAGAPVLAVGAGTIADVIPLQNRAIASSLFISAPFLGPGLGPIIGGFLAYYKGYKWTQWCTIWIAAAAYITVIPMQETYKKIILKRHAKKMGIPLPPGPTGWTSIKFLITVTMIRPVAMLFTEPLVLLLSLYNGFAFSVLFAFFAAYPYSFGKIYHFNTWQYGLTFVAIAVGVLIALPMAIAIDRLYYMKKFKQAVQAGGTAASPEYRLPIAMIGSFGLPIGLFWFAWSCRSDVHWISPTLAGLPVAWGNMCIFLGAAFYLIDVYGPLTGASALAANGLLRYSLGGCFPLWTVQMYEAMGIDWATSLLGFVSVLMLPIPWVFYRYGKNIRRRSRYDTIEA